MVHSKIAAIKAYIPPKIVANRIFEERFRFPSGYIERKTGLRARRHAEKGEHPTKMGLAAAKLTFGDAQMMPEAVDMIISASTSRDQSIPTDAMVYAHLLGVENVQCLHIEAVCLSFINALELADLYIRSDRCKCILIISSEQTSRVIDYEDPSSSILLGDGAAAALIMSDDGNSRIEATHIKTEALGENINVAYMKGGGLKHHPYDSDFTPDMAGFHVNGGLELTLAIRHFPQFLNTLFERAQCSFDEIDHVIPHQVVPRMIQKILKNLGFSKQKIHINDSYGNQAAASIPIGLAELVDIGRVKRGDRVLLIGGAAGFSLGGAILVY